MTKPDIISDEQLTQTHGGMQAHPGAQTYRELTSFANAHGYVVTSSTGGHHLGWAHKAGRAVDVRTRGHGAADIRSFIRDARAHHITVIDERGGGNAAWSGPHLHLQK